ncbi:unnamed protein product [Staurois parvus]|uniref:Uncharacterized protein n=1 Tax=Staurois parvus TaxID=386267 RepID=A0ABN9EDT5_9NEOB|nr:unnamed protein product [Staurois parvus]
MPTGRGAVLHFAPNLYILGISLKLLCKHLEVSCISSFASLRNASSI